MRRPLYVPKDEPDRWRPRPHAAEFRPSTHRCPLGISDSKKKLNSNQFLRVFQIVILLYFTQVHHRLIFYDLGKNDKIELQSRNNYIELTILPKYYSDYKIILRLKYTESHHRTINAIVIFVGNKVFSGADKK